MSASIQPRSGLNALKRSWSGSSHDLGDDGRDDDVKVAPTKAQRKLDERARERTSTSSSQTEYIEGWEPTPPEKQRAARQMLYDIDGNARRGHGYPNALKPMKSDPFPSEKPFPSQHSSSSSQLSGVRVSGLSRGLARSPSFNESRHSDSPPSPPKPSKGSSMAERSIPAAFSTSEAAKTRQLPADFAAPQFRPASKAELLAQRQRKEIERQQAESGSSKTVSKEEKDVTVPSMFMLSQQQRYVHDLVCQQGKSVFFTGSAGTGKSVLLREIIKVLKKKYEKRQDCVAVTASTGIAACNIGGVTLHSFAGIGLGLEDVPTLVRKIRRNRKAVGRWARTQVLIIDEVSMVEPDLLDKLDGVARALRKTPSKPFGGIQIIITGDFFQLPPVMKNTGTRFAFEAKMWDEALSHKVNLTQVFRQKDQTFVRMLNEMRMGTLSKDSVERFRSLNRPPKAALDVTPTELFPHREDVDKANKERLIQIKGFGQSYEARDTGQLPSDQLEKVLSQFMAPPKIFLKKEAQVMLIKNMDETLVNGSTGVVKGFLTLHEFSLAKQALPNLYEDKYLDQLGDLQKQWTMREQSPEKGAIASLSAPGGNGGGSGRSTPEPGAAGAGRKGAAANSTAAKQKWPLVRFPLPNGNGVRTELIQTETWKNELPNGEIQAQRSQLPLILAWAMSIHKSQGQTIPCCKIDLGRVFERGQAYVALSRATSLEGLQVCRFDPKKVMAHPRVIEWSKGLATMGVPGT